MKRKSGFTLIELLVVVAIIALLIAILLPSLNKARENAKKTVCATNLKAEGMGFALYASQFSDYLPFYKGGPDQYNLFDCDPRIADIMLTTTANGLNSSSTGGSNAMNEDSMRRLFYCPSNTTQNTNALWTWNVATGGGGGRVLGYFWLVDRGGPATSGPPRTYIAGQLAGAKVNGQTRAYPPLEAHTKFSSTLYPSVSELATDMVVSQNANAGFTQITNINSNGNTFETSHKTGSSWTGGAVPTGQNVLCFDAHVEWRAWGGSDKSNYAIVTPGGSPSSYIMNPK